ncbi:60S ribosomal protein L20, partial [Linnemannia gamsii]
MSREASIVATAFSLHPAGLAGSALSRFSFWISKQCDLGLAIVVCSTDLSSCHLLDTRVQGSRALHEYQLVGRHLPTEKDATPKLFRMRLFATNEVIAKSRFWYFMRKLKKVKKVNGEIVGINE